KKFSARLCASAVDCDEAGRTAGGPCGRPGPITLQGVNHVEQDAPPRPPGPPPAGQQPCPFPDRPSQAVSSLLRAVGVTLRPHLLRGRYGWRPARALRRG